MDYTEYQILKLEEIIGKCMEAAKRGETDFELPSEGLTEGDLRYLEMEIERRLS